jgi:hypothetical protein
VIGFSIGATLSFAILAGLVGWFIIQHRRRNKDKDNGDEKKAPVKILSWGYWRKEWNHELPGADQRFEMDGHGRRFELLSNPRQLAHELAVRERILELPS